MLTMSVEQSERPVYTFGGFTLDLSRAMLLDPQGAEVPLRPKSLALLTYLLEHSGRVVGRDELMAELWPGIRVVNDSLAQCVHDVRRALGDGGQQLLRTLPRHGYLLTVEVCRSATVAATVASRSTNDDAAPRPPANRPMVVVLPLKSIGGDARSAQGYFAAGMTADLATDLTRHQVLHVVVSPAAGAGIPVAAAYTVGGEVRRDGDRVRVNVHLDDARSGVRLWAERYDRPLGDLFAVQEELAGGIAADLVARVEQEDLRRALRRHPSCLDAYDLLLRGRDLHHRTTEAATLEARTMFARAIEADPAYGQAHAWQAFTLQRGFSQWWGEPRGQEALPAALAHAERAAALEPDSPACVAVLAYVQMLCGRWDEALDTGRAAVRLNPGSHAGRASYGSVLVQAGGDVEEAVRETRFALSLDPFRPPRLRQQLGRALLLAGRPEEALEELRPLAAQLPDYALCHHTMAVAAVEAGHMDEAQAAMREVRRLGPHWTLRSIGAFCHFRRSADTKRFRAAYRAAGLPED